MVSVAFAQNKTINGKVTSAGDGLPLPGVSVAVKGNTQVGTQTDVNGNYSLSVPQTAKTLVFTYIGFVIKEATANSTTNVQLFEDEKLLSEVVVTGYGTQNKSSSTNCFF
jgi:hypothetical protein